METGQKPVTVMVQDTRSLGSKLFPTGFAKQAKRNPEKTANEASAAQMYKFLVSSQRLEDWSKLAKWLAKQPGVVKQKSRLENSIEKYRAKIDALQLELESIDKFSVTVAPGVNEAENALEDFRLVFNTDDGIPNKDQASELAKRISELTAKYVVEKE